MDVLTLEEWLDMREAIQRRINELRSFQSLGEEVERERLRRLASLERSLARMEDHIKDLQYELDN